MRFIYTLQINNAIYNAIITLEKNNPQIFRDTSDRGKKNPSTDLRIYMPWGRFKAAADVADEHLGPLRLYYHFSSISMGLVHSAAYASLAPNREQHYEAEHIYVYICIRIYMYVLCFSQWNEVFAVIQNALIRF